MAIIGILREAQRRNLPRACIGYLASAWALAQGIASLAPVVGAPDWTARWFVVAAGVGFPVWTIFAWFYELTPTGIKREPEVEADPARARAANRRLDFWIIGALSVAVVLLLTDRFLRNETASDPSGSRQSIAVLPFVNESGDAGMVYFSDGLSEGFIDALSQLPGLKVIGRSSSFQFRGGKDAAVTIGKKLGVAHLLEGSVQRAGDAVRVSAEMIDTEDGVTLWSQRYDRPYKDLFRLQDDITSAVAAALKTKLLDGGRAPPRSDRPPSGNLAAYNAYLLGTYLNNSRIDEADKHKAIDAFTAATRMDPRYAEAWAGLAIARTNLAAGYLSGTAEQQLYAQARIAANTALTLNPDSPDAYIARGTVLENADADLTGAERDYRRALEFAPNASSAKFDLGSVLAKLGQLDKAIALNRESLVNDPLNASTFFQTASYLLPLGRFDEAMQAISRANALEPDGAGFHTVMAMIETLRGHGDAALAAARLEPPGPWRNVALALALQIGTDRAAADKALNDLVAADAGDAPFQIAEVHALRGDPDKMYEWLDRAWAARDGGVQTLLYDPFILRYRKDPRLAAYCRKVGLPPPA